MDDELYRRVFQQDDPITEAIMINEMFDDDDQLVGAMLQEQNRVLNDFVLAHENRRGGGLFTN